MRAGNVITLFGVESSDFVRVRLDLGYEGTAFFGWARQPDLRTVQLVVEEGLAQVLRVPLRATVAGRTDAGVHARAQVCHVDIPRSIWGTIRGHRPVSESKVLFRMLNAVLPDDVALREVSLAHPKFDARYSALWRRYSYRVSSRGVWVDPLRRHTVTDGKYPLNIERMNVAAQSALGEHDFIGFCKPRVGATTIRTLQNFLWVEEADGIFRADVQADAFCHSMVRSLVGVCLTIGRGKKPTTWLAEILEARVRNTEVNVAPARGLVLEEVRYPADDKLEEQARSARRRRSLAVEPDCCGL